MKTKKVLAAALATVLSLGVVYSDGIVANASDTLPYVGESAKGENQGYSHGYRCEDLLEWSPETDVYSQYLKASVPLQKRIPAFAPTQANPNLSADAEWMVMAGDYGNAFFDAYNYTNEFSQYEFNYWQYISGYGSWHGQPTEEVDMAQLYVDERGVTDAWKNRKYEFGVVNIPNGGYTNAAHKNGVISLGCIFVPRTGLHTDVLLTKDKNGNYPYADKLAQMCEYFGFDGYFLNLEESLPSSLITEYRNFISYCTNTLGLYIQWYDGPTDTRGTLSYQNQLNSTNDGWLVGSRGEKIADSVFLNYWWNYNMNSSSASYAKKVGLNPYKSVYVGIEAGGDRWQQSYDLRNNIGKDGKAMNSFVSLGSEFVHDGLDEDLENGANNNIAMRREKDEYQWMTFLRERIWWSGPFADPSLASSSINRNQYNSSTTGIDYKGVGIANTSSDRSLTFDGVAAYVTENSVIGGTVFNTNFNTGHGMEWVENGNVMSDKEWSNISLQDILPTWQWWIEKDSNVSRLNVDFDYGTRLGKTLSNGAASQFEFNPVGAYTGGNSLVVNGNVDGESFLHLYKTKLYVDATSFVDVTFKKSSEDFAKMNLGVIFEENPAETVILDIPFSEQNTNGEWVTSSVDLSAYAGMTIAAFGLVFSSEEPAYGYQMNIGEMRFTDGGYYTPGTPSGFSFEKVYDTGEMTVTWNLDSYDYVSGYRLFARYEDGTVRFLGGIYDDIFYVKDVVNTDGRVDLLLYSVGKDGRMCDVPAEISYDYRVAVKDIQVSQKGSMLSVSWVDYANAPQTVSFETMYKNQKVTVEANENNDSAVLNVPTGKDADYTRYMIKVNTVGGESVTYEGKLLDTYCEPYAGSIISATGKLTAPLSKDWYKMKYQYVTRVTNGRYTTSGSAKTVTRYGADMPTVSSSYKGVLVTLTDYSGNTSSQVYISR